MRQRDFIRIERLTPRQERLRIVSDVAAEHRLPAEALLGRRRTRNIAQARWQAMAEIRARFGDSTNQIGRLFGRDHTTVVHGLQAYRQLLMEAAR
jgi:chromosomal replication initiator protein